MSIGDQIVREISEKLTVRGARFEFAVRPRFLSNRLLALPLGERRQALEKLAVFAFFLSKEKGSPEAGRTILDILEEVAKKTLRPRTTP